MKRKINIIIAAADVILAAIMAAGLLFAAALIKQVSLQPAADGYGGKNSAVPYSAVSIYSAENAAETLGDIYGMRAEIMKKTEEQLADAGENVFCDCWYGEKAITLTGTKGNTSVKGVYTGGDYFTVHRPQIISGSPYTSETVNIDTVVLDEYAAWKLFGALNITGMTVEADNMTFYVTAVIKAPESGRKVLKAAYDSDVLPSVYFPAEAANVIFKEEQKFTGYDILMPDPIKEFAVGIVRKAAGAEEDSVTKTVTDSRSRFSIKNMRDAAKKLETAADSGTEIIYPYYEDAARTVMLILGIIYKVEFPVFVLLMLSACYWVVRLCGLAVYIVKRIYGFADGKAEEKKLENYYKTHPKIIIKESDEGDAQ